jgi:hypothetical protein
MLLTLPDPGRQKLVGVSSLSISLPLESTILRELGVAAFTVFGVVVTAFKLRRA